MNYTANSSTVSRNRAEWMAPVDEKILEELRDEGNLTPAAIDHLEVCAANHASNRLSLMQDKDVVEKVYRGLYRLAPKGEAFLDEDPDWQQMGDGPSDDEQNNLDDFD